jgi:hypothetical protein
VEKIFSPFILLVSNIRRILTGVGSTGIKITHTSWYYTERIRMRRKYAKLSIGADVLQQSYELLHGFSIISHRYEDVPI